MKEPLAAHSDVSFVHFVAMPCIQPAPMDHSAIYTHEDLARWRSCPRRFWLQRHDPGRIPSTNPLSGLQQVLKASFPHAVAIAPAGNESQWQKALAHTRSLLSEGWLADHPVEGSADEGRAILGACLESNEGIRVRVDVLTNGPYGLRLFKVRLATVGHDHDVDQVALWTHVAARQGLRIHSAGLLLVDTDFVYPGMACYAGLLRETELMPVLGSRAVADWLIAMRRCERAALPAVATDAPCHETPLCHFVGVCGTSLPPHRRDSPDAMVDLAIVGRELAAELRESGHIDVMTIRLDELPDERRRRAVSAIQKGQAILEPDVSAKMAALPYPRAFLRIDTIGFAIPTWPGTRPYQIMPFQWNADVACAPGQVQHHAFLATAQGDPRRAFATTLLEALGTKGAILAYNAGFERNRLRELADTLPDLASQLEAVQARIVDLYQIARAHYYHPQMCGSWSFKSLVRAIAPHTGADQFYWQGIEEAQEAFALSLQGQIPQAELDELRQALLAYGQRQTSALGHIVQCFEMAGGMQQKA